MKNPLTVANPIRAAQNRQMVAEHLNIAGYIEQERTVQATPSDQLLPKAVKVAEYNPARLPKLNEGFVQPHIPH